MTRAQPDPPPPRDRWADAALAVLGLVLPVACVGCGAPDRALCRSCRAELDALPTCRRLVAGVRLDAAWSYEGLVRTLVLECKLRSRVDLAGPLAGRFGVLVRRALADHPEAVLLRVPPSRRGARRRGFDPVVLLLGRARLRRPRALVRVRVGGPGQRVAAGHGQKERTAVERVVATVGALRATGVTGRDVVLVDDVVTTGVTMAEAIRAVRVAGGRVVRCVALAEVDAR
ncbi:ComF family protein [Curtobacterium citreum]|uniref:ComF family protein n=1 Tax=uncultured Curtobacterium sp. TaxID=331964 RepID=UPI002590BE52|nr:phosphoribosyltransferase family protein [uncultured Curtobacterium sp.]